MRLLADRDKCEGHGVCVAQAPGLLDMDDDDIVVVSAGEVEGDDIGRAEIAVESCPVAALRLE